MKFFVFCFFSLSIFNLSAQFHIDRLAIELSDQNQDWNKFIAKYNDTISAYQTKYNDDLFNINEELNSVKLLKSKCNDTLVELGQQAISTKNNIGKFNSNSKKEELYKKLIGKKFLDIDKPENDKIIKKTNKYLLKVMQLSDSNHFIYFKGINETEVSVVAFFHSKEFQFIEFVLDDKHDGKFIFNTKLEWSIIDDKFLYDNLGLDNTYFELISQLESNNREIENLKIRISSLDLKASDLESKKLELEKIFLSKKSLFQRAIDTAEVNKLNKENESRIELNKSIYKTKKINGIEICMAPLDVETFNDGKAIVHARTQNEWDSFLEQKIPAYAYENFEEENANNGLVYNFYAVSNSNNLAPVGFHVFNYLDFLKVEFTPVFEENNVVCTRCDGKGIRDESIYCDHCNSWTKEQKKYNVCPKCNNKRFLGTKKVSCPKTMADHSKIDFWVLPSLFEISQHEFPSINNNCDKFYSGIEDCYLENSTSIYLGSRVHNYLIAKDHEHPLFIELSIPSIYARKEGHKIFICKNQQQKPKPTGVQEIADLNWSKSLLSTNKFNNGDEIKQVNDDVEWEIFLSKGVPAFRIIDNVYYYNIHAILDSRQIVPKEFRIPTIYDLNNLLLTSKKTVFDFYSNENIFVWGFSDVKTPGFSSHLESRKWKIQNTGKKVITEGFLKIVKDYSSSSNQDKNHPFFRGYQIVYVSEITNLTSNKNQDKINTENEEKSIIHGDKGSGQGIGSNNVSGEGTGQVSDNVSSPLRVRLNNPDVDHIKTTKEATVRLKLTVNANGDVIEAIFMQINSTTTDARIIDEVISAVKKQVKYNKLSNEGQSIVYLTINLNAK